MVLTKAEKKIITKMKMRRAFGRLRAQIRMSKLTKGSLKNKKPLVELLNTKERKLMRRVMNE